MLRNIQNRYLHINKLRRSHFAFSKVASNSPSPSQALSSNDANTAPTPCPRNFGKYRQHSAINGFYWSSPYGQLNMPELTIDQYVWSNITKWSNKVAIECGITGRKYTFARLRDHCSAVAHRLRTDYDLQRGDVVAISMTNEPEYVIALLGALEAGLVVTTVNPIYTKREHVKQLAMSNAKLLFGHAQRADLLLSSVAQVAVEQKSAPMPIVVLRTNSLEPLPTGVRDFAELMDLTKDNKLGSLSPAGHGPDDIAVIPYSSGTTGLPKGVQLTHRNLTSNCEMMNAPLPDERVIRAATSDFQDIVPCVLPIHHLYGLVALTFSKLSLGCKLVTLPSFDPLVFLQMIGDHRATFLPLVPSLLLFLANDERAQRQHLEHVRIIMCGAAPSGGSDADRLRERKAPRDVHFFQAYGMTELSPIATLSTLPNTNYDSIGRPVPGVELKIIRLHEDSVNTDGMGLDASEEGELLVRGPCVMHSYLNNPEATAAMKMSGGWLRTGDVAIYDEEGHFFIKDRVKELIKVQGYQVAPAELEEVLRSHPLVLDAGVIGVKHERSGEVPRAFVSVRPGVSVAELQEFVADRVAKFKRLTGGIEFVDAVPRSPTGKILRRQLR